MKRFISILLVLCFMVILPIQVFATSVRLLSYSSLEGKAHIAYVENVNSTGSNIEIEDVNGNYKTENATINTSFEDTISISTTINGETISFLGVPIARTDSGKSVFFEGICSNERYEIVDFTYVTDISVTNMFFVNSKNDYDAQTILKIYLKDTSSQTRDYYFIEVFDVGLKLNNEVLMTLEVNHLIGNWGINEFEAVSTEIGEISNTTAPRAATNSRTWFCKKTFFNMADEQTHYIYWTSNLDFSSVPRGQEANQYYRLTVTGKNSSSTLNPDLNSSTQSCLHITGLELHQTSRPNTAWKSTRIDGIVQDNSITGRLLSASLSVSLGLLEVSLGIPDDFYFARIIDIDDMYTGYINGIIGRYTRSICTKMGSSFSLTQIGHYFEVISTLRDYGNVTMTGHTLFATWHIDVTNAITNDVHGFTCEHNVIISIV